jgi:ADP-ribose pyrophosphatase YjhB (NUDIX family)
VGILDGWQHCPRCAEPLTQAEGRVECESCGLVHWAHSTPAVAALVTDADGSVLLAKRAHEPYAGRWDSPGGFLEEGEAPLDGLRREILEETGLTIEPGDFVGAHVDSYGEDADSPAVLNLVWEAIAVAGEAAPADDVSELHWFHVDGLPPAEELAFRWLAPSLRDWAARAEQA